MEQLEAQKALEPIVIEENQYRKLEELVTTPSLQSLTDKFISLYPRILSPSEMALGNIEISPCIMCIACEHTKGHCDPRKLIQKGFLRTYDHRENVGEHILRTQHLLHKSSIFKDDIGKLITVLDGHQSDIIRELSNAKRDPIVQRLKTKFDKIYEKISDHDEHKPVVECIRWVVSFADTSLVDEYLTLKIKRLRKLKEISEEHAASYLDLSVMNEGYDIEKLNKNIIGDNAEDPTTHYIIRFWQEDDKLYKNILKNISFRERQETEKKQIVTVSKPSQVVVPIIKEATIDEKLVELISGHNGLFNYDMKKRIQYFAEDAVDLGVSKENLGKLYDSFFRFKLDRVMKKRETALSEVRLRSFFDDITQKYLVKGVIPSKEDLETVYFSVLTEK